VSGSVHSIGIIGAGKVGIVLAQLAIKAGYTVYIAGSGSPEKIALTVSVLVPGAVALTAKEVAEKAEVIIVAIPLGKYQQLPKEALAGKLVIDAMNYWWEVDGERPELTSNTVGSSEVVQQFLSNSRVVKAFSHIGYHDLYDETRPEGAPDRKAVAIAGNDPVDVATVATIVNNLGFDPVTLNSLAKGIQLQPGSPVFGAHVDVKMLKEMLSSIPSAT